MCLAAPASAWNDFGHMQAAALAWQRLTPQARVRVTALLKLNPSYGRWTRGVKAAQRDRVAFLRASTWADAIKGDSRYRNDDEKAPAASQNLGYRDLLRHKYWHYVDQPFSPDGARLPAVPEPNAATQVELFRRVLSAPGGSEDVKSYDLTWLLHLVADLHQPLHCVERYERSDRDGDRGGNEVKLRAAESPALCEDPRFCPFGEPDNLHILWDGLTGASYSVASVDAENARLPEPSARKAGRLDTATWLAEGLALAKTHVYAAPIGRGHGPFAMTREYQEQALRLARKRISLAGARLAGVLNEAFASEAAHP
jgi:hypothetical protein